MLPDALIRVRQTTCEVNVSGVFFPFPEKKYKKKPWSQVTNPRSLKGTETDLTQAQEKITDSHFWIF